MSGRVDCGLEGPVVRRVRVFGEAPELVEPPRGHLLAAEVVAFLAGEDQTGLHAEQHRKVLALRQQRTERIDHAAVVRIGQRAGGPLLRALQRQRLPGGLQPAEQERACSAPEAEFEGGFPVDHEQPAPRPAPVSRCSASKRNRASGAGTPTLRGSPNLIITDRPYGTLRIGTTGY